MDPGLLPTSFQCLTAFKAANDCCLVLPHNCHQGQIPGLMPSLLFTDVPSWLKSLRLHKYAALFSQMSYEEMMTLTEQHLESQVKLRGPLGHG